MPWRPIHKQNSMFVVFFFFQMVYVFNCMLFVKQLSEKISFQHSRMRSLIKYKILSINEIIIAVDRCGLTCQT